MRKWFAAFVASILAVAACGARSGLEIGPPDPHQTGAVGGGTGTGGTSGSSTSTSTSMGSGGSGGLPVDAGLDAIEEASFDAPPDVLDAPEDAPPDVLDAPEDAPPDVTDAPPPTGCEDAGTTYIYVISQEDALYRYYPPDNSFVLIGTIACPLSGTNHPFSMAVDRKGKAYVLFEGGKLYEVSTATAACAETTFQPNQGGFNSTFGMGFSSNAGDPGETLFVAEAASTERLATIDPVTLQLSIVGPFSKTLGSAELTGTGDARLFAFGIDSSVNGSHLAEIDKATAAVLSDVILPVGSNVHAWAFAFWGGDFYFFTSAQFGSSTVTRYHPADGSIGPVATLGKTIVGAGVSTCAPQ